MTAAPDPKSAQDPSVTTRQIKHPANVRNKGRSREGLVPRLKPIPESVPPHAVAPAVDIPLPNPPPAKRKPRNTSLAKPAAKRHPRRISGEVPSPVPARKKARKPLSIRPLPPKRLSPAPPVSARTPAPQPHWQKHAVDSGTPLAPSWLDRIWKDLSGRLRAQWFRIRPERLLLAKATARYHELLRELESTRPSV